MDAANLIRRARDGDQQALNELLAAHRESLRRQAEQSLDVRVQGRIDASDVVQQTCLSVFRQIAEFEGTDPAQFAAWLARIHDHNIQNVVRNQLHAQKRNVSREEPLGDRDPDSSRQVTPSQHAMQREEATRLEETLSLLPPDEREALRLRFTEGWTLSQLSDHLGLTKDATAWLLHRAVKRLRKLMNETS